MNFTPDLEIGVANIDSQHKELFERINAVMLSGTKAASKEETDKTVKMLEDYVVKHFRDEEALMLKHKYPEMDAHKQLHKDFIKSFGELKSEYAKNGPSPVLTLQINKSIISWIVKHIRTSDMALGQFINK